MTCTDKRRSKSSSNTALTGKSGPGLKTPRGHRTDDQPLSPSATFDALAAVMVGASTNHTPLHTQQPPVTWPHHSVANVHSQSADQLHLTQHQQQHIAAAQLQQQHLAALNVAAAAAANVGTGSQQPSQQQQQHSLAVTASGGPKVALQRTVSRNVAITLPRNSDTPLHTPAATGTKPDSAPASLESSRSLHAAANHHHHPTSAGTQLFTPVPHKAPHMLHPPALMYSQPAAVTPAIGGGPQSHLPAAAANGPLSSATATPHPASARNGGPGNGVGSSDDDDGMREDEKAVDREASDADDEDDSEEVMDEDDADVDLADLEHDAHGGSGVRKRAAGSHKKGAGKANRLSGSPRGRAGARAGTLAGPPAMPRRSSGVVGASNAGVVTRGREGH